MSEKKEYLNVGSYTPPDENGIEPDWAAVKAVQDKLIEVL